MRRILKSRCGLRIFSAHVEAGDHRFADTANVSLVSVHSEHARALQVDFGEGWRERKIVVQHLAHVVPPRTPNRWRLDAPAHVVVWAIPEPVVSRWLSEWKGLDPAGFFEGVAAQGCNLPAVHAFTAQVEAAVHTGTQSDALLQAVGLVMFHQMAMHWSRTSRPAAPRALSATRLQETLRYLSDNIGRSVKVKDVAEVLHMSPSAFHKGFKAATGEAPLAYFLRYRLEKAKALLESGGHSVTEAALACGFFDASHFGKTFKAHFHTLPSDHMAATPRQARRWKQPASEQSLRQGMWRGTGPRGASGSADSS